MKIPLDWLKEYIPGLPPVQKLVETLMMHGLEVEEVIDEGEKFNSVVVGEIVQIQPHPNADKLRLADVILTPKGKPQEIVCGAPNIVVGQKVAVALVGAKLANGLTIEAREIRGVKSRGMICAEDELGLGKNHRGVIILEPGLKVGTPFAKAMGFDGVVLDLATPANRADLMAVRGLAWEIAAILGKPVTFPKVKLIESKTPALKSISLRIEDLKLTPVLTARVVRGITMKPSPDWLVQRLRAAGMRSVNVIVDSTNYIMLEYGQPLHAYDADTLHGQQLISRRSKAGERLTTLDGQDRGLTPEMLVIADADRPVGLAGVMGGQDTQVTATTKNIVLEAAVFNPVTVRKTSRQLGLVSEASKRFEKGLWPSLPGQASAAAAAMIAELAGGIVEKGIVTAGKGPARPITIPFDPKYVTERLGMTVTPTKSKGVLTKLGFGITGSKRWSVQVPEWRLDVSLPEDVVDEIGRVIGYERVPQTMPPLNDAPGPKPVMLEWKDTVRQTLLSLGFIEIITHSYYGQTDKQKVQGEHVEIANPLDAQQQYLRRSLGPSMSKVLEASIDAGQDARMFEISRGFMPPATPDLAKAQPWMLIVGLAFKPPAGYVEGYEVEKMKHELFSAVGVNDIPGFQTASAKTKGRVSEMLELDLKILLQARRKKQTAGVAKYPPVTRDISFWWSGNEADIQRRIEELKLPLLKHTMPKDKFIKDGKTSYAYTFVYQSPDRTLTKPEVDALEKRIKDALRKHGATIRE